MDLHTTWQAVLALNLLASITAGIVATELQKRVPMQHPSTGQSKQGYSGYCWPYLLLGGLVPMARGETGRGFLHILFTVATLGVFQVVMPYFYNRQHMQRLEATGWQVGAVSEPVLASAAQGVPSASQPDQAQAGGAEHYLGQIQLFASDIIPQGWLPCDGKALQVREHAALYALLGKRHGGDGLMAFHLPNLIGKEPAAGMVYGICVSGVFPSR